MGRRKATPTSGVKRKSRPATTPEARMNQLVAKAYDLVEQRLEDGTATSQETTTLIKYGSEKAKLEAEKLRHETELLKSKKQAIDSAKVIEDLYKDAIAAMKTYSGKEDENYDQDVL